MSSLHRTHSWILGGYGLEYSAQHPISDGALCDVADGFLRQVLPLLAQQGAGAVRDLKGRNAQDELLPGVGHPSHDEVFRLGGLAAVPHEEPTLALEPFEVSLLSAFQSFEGTHHIVHTLEQHRAGPLPPWVPLRLLGYVAPLKPTFLRIGIERFRSLLGFASLGYAPQVTDSLLVDCIGGTLAVRVTSERNRSRDANPFDEIPAFRAVAAAIRAAIGIDLRGDLAAKLAGTP